MRIFWLGRSPRGAGAGRETSSRVCAGRHEPLPAAFGLGRSPERGAPSKPPLLGLWKLLIWDDSSVSAAEARSPNPYSPPEGSLEAKTARRGWGSDLLAGVWLLLAGRSFYVLLFFQPSGTQGHDALDALGEFLAAMVWPLLAALVVAGVRAGVGGRGTPFRGTLIGATLLLPILTCCAVELWGWVT